MAKKETPKLANVYARMGSAWGKPDGPNVEVRIDNRKQRRRFDSKKWKYKHKIGEQNAQNA